MVSPVEESGGGHPEGQHVPWESSVDAEWLAFQLKTITIDAEDGLTGPCVKLLCNSGAVTL